MLSLISGIDAPIERARVSVTSFAARSIAWPL
jgi:hypothetical protein